MTVRKSPNSVTTVRTRQPDDLDACAAALVEVHEKDGYPVEGVDDPQAWLMPASLLEAWVGELSGEIVGHVLITAPQAGDDAANLMMENSRQSIESVGVLGRLFVLPKARGQAIGDQLVRVTMKYAELRNLRLVLDVMEKDQAAIRLYERLGWQRIGAAVHRFGDDQEIPAYCYVAPLPGNTNA